MEEIKNCSKLVLIKGGILPTLCANIMDAKPKSVKDELYPHLRAVQKTPDMGTCAVTAKPNLGSHLRKKASKSYAGT